VTAHYRRLKEEDITKVNSHTPKRRGCWRRAEIKKEEKNKNGEAAKERRSGPEQKKHNEKEVREWEA